MKLKCQNQLGLLLEACQGKLLQSYFSNISFINKDFVNFRMAATLFVQPMDLIKNRMQLSGEGGKAKEHRNTLHAIRSIMMKEGISGMYSGLSAGLLRQATYTTTRLGIYTWLFDTMSGLVGL